MCEELLSYIDHINDVCMESEVTVLSSISDVYEKASILQEYTDSEMLADSILFTESDKPKEAYVGSRILNFLRKIWEGIVKLFKFIIRKIKGFFMHLSPKYLMSLIASRNSEVKKVLENAGYKVRVEYDGTWTILAEAFDVRLLKEAIDEVTKHMDDIKVAIDEIGKENSDRKAINKACRAIRKPRPMIISDVLKKHKVWIPYDELVEEMTKLDKTLDPLLDRSTAIQKSIKSIQQKKRIDEDKNYETTLRDIQEMSNMLFKDISKANEHYTRVMTEQSKSQEQMQLEIEQIIAKGYDKIQNRNPMSMKSYRNKMNRATNADSKVAAKAAEKAKTSMSAKKDARLWSLQHSSNKAAQVRAEQNAKTAKELDKYVKDTARFRGQTATLNPDRERQEADRKKAKDLREGVKETEKKIKDLEKKAEDLDQKAMEVNSNRFKGDVGESTDKALQQRSEKLRKQAEKIRDVEIENLRNDIKIDLQDADALYNRSFNGPFVNHKKWDKYVKDEAYEDDED